MDDSGVEEAVCSGIPKPAVKGPGVAVVVLRPNSDDNGVPLRVSRPRPKTDENLKFGLSGCPSNQDKKLWRCESVGIPQ